MWTHRRPNRRKRLGFRLWFAETSRHRRRRRHANHRQPQHAQSGIEDCRKKRQLPFRRTKRQMAGNVRQPRFLWCFEHEALSAASGEAVEIENCDSIWYQRLYTMAQLPLYRTCRNRKYCCTPNNSGMNHFPKHIRWVL